MSRKVILLFVIAMLLQVNFAFGHARWRNHEGTDDFSDPCNWNDAKNRIGGRLIIDGGPNHPSPGKDCNAPIMSYTPNPCYAPRDLQGPGWDANISSQGYIK